MNILETRSLEASHGQLQAVRDVSLAVAAGQVVALIGANGAGKTTLLRCIAGVHRAAGGSVLLAGQDVTGLSAHGRVGAGLAMVPEGRRLFDGMTVRENLQVAGDAGRRGRWTLDTVVDALPALRPIIDLPTNGLSGGQRQAVAIGRALMTNPRVLLLDEVSLGLSPAAVQALYDNLASLRHDGATTLVLVEQDLDRALSFADRFACMREGRIVLQGTPAAVPKQDITHAYFGIESAAIGETCS